MQSSAFQEIMHYWAYKAVSNTANWVNKLNPENGNHSGTKIWERR
jgi:hypothetical protein